ncbi:hypothetical protein [Sphingobacterium faecium]|uniref:toxin-antitoxin system YwqK family antitoxin n=1 Tax=Sphingobacterium faecium TaxID=34087 RepID=UPI0032089A7A
MRVNFDEIETGSPNRGGGNMYYYKDEPFTGLIEEYNENGVLIAELTVKNGNVHGRSANYYNSGQIMDEKYIAYNRPYGFYREWDESGNLIEEIDFGPEHTP